VYRHFYDDAKLSLVSVRSGFTGIVIALAAMLACFAVTAAAAAEAQVVDIATRPGQRVRALELKPAKPVGSVILLAGGHGNLALTRDGRIGWGGQNQLVRTRAEYAQAGFVTLVPDIAPDLKRGEDVKPRYRFSPEYAADIGALVAYLRGVAPPVYLVGTSRAALSVANAAVRLTGPRRPDGLVITSGMLMHIDDTQPSVAATIGRLGRMTQPVLLVFHADDTCVWTRASSARRFKALLTRAAKVDIALLRGGPSGSGDPCESFAHHGFFGQDGEVVRTVTRWLKRLN
jgi:dienelactone hydrolase